jgi:hypothetical protein
MIAQQAAAQIKKALCRFAHTGCSENTQQSPFSRAAFTRLLVFLPGQPFYGWFRSLASALQPVSTGLPLWLQPLLVPTGHRLPP